MLLKGNLTRRMTWQGSDCIFCMSPKTNLCPKIRGTQGKGVMPDGTSRFTLKKVRCFLRLLPSRLLCSWTLKSLKTFLKALLKAFLGPSRMARRSITSWAAQRYSDSQNGKVQVSKSCHPCRAALRFAEYTVLAEISCAKINPEADLEKPLGSSHCFATQVIVCRAKAELAKAKDVLVWLRHSNWTGRCLEQCKGQF